VIACILNVIAGNLSIAGSKASEGDVLAIGGTQ